MRYATVDGRLKLLVGVGQVDVHTASSGRLAPTVGERWDALAAMNQWARMVSAPTEPFDPTRAGSPVPEPRQIFAVGLNYAEGAAESGFQRPDHPAGNYCEYYADLDVIPESSAWEPQQMQGSWRLYNWGSPPPSRFLEHDDVGDLVARRP